MSTHRRVTSAYWSSKLCEFGKIAEGTEDIKQCISIILTTVKGSVPHRLDFGCDIWKYLDLPPSEAVPNIIYEVNSALETWEPRAVLDDVSAAAYDISHYIICVKWHPSGASDTDYIIQEITV